jgi:hypothetical protein
MKEATLPGVSEFSTIAAAASSSSLTFTFTLASSSSFTSAFALPLAGGLCRSLYLIQIIFRVDAWGGGVWRGFGRGLVCGVASLLGSEGFQSRCVRGFVWRGFGL